VRNNKGLVPGVDVEAPDADARHGQTDGADRAAPAGEAAAEDPPAPMGPPRGVSGYRARASKSKKSKNIKDLPQDLTAPKDRFSKPAPLRRARTPRGLPRRIEPSAGPAPLSQAEEAVVEALDEVVASQKIVAGQALTPVAGQAASTSFFPFAPEKIAPDVLSAWETIARTYRNDPVGFAQDLLGVTPDDWQAGCMNYVGQGGKLLSVRAGHGVGKSAFCSWLVLHNLGTWFPQKTVLTAPTQGQLFDALFSEVKFWLRRLPTWLRELFEPQAERIVLKDNAEASFVSARTSSKERPEALAGIHCEQGRVLLIADEASAIPEEVYEAATGSMSGKETCTVLISNPTRNSGLFYDTHHRLKLVTELVDGKLVTTGKWKTVHISCLDSARADRSFVEQIIETYGIESNQYRVRVLGEFATREDDVLIAAALVDAAVKRTIEIDPGAPLTYGLDVARFGDDRTVLCKRRGGVVIEFKWWAKEDTMATVGRVLNEARLDKPDEICVDSIGIGAGVADRLRELGLPVRDINVAESSPLNPTAARLRDDLWLQVRDWLTSGACSLPKDCERIQQDLKAPTYSFNSAGRIVVEPKAMMKKRKLPSPDYADALCLTFGGDAAMVGGRMTMWGNHKGPLRRNIPGVV
jgi:phage terminase large subunit